MTPVEVGLKLGVSKALNVERVLNRAESVSAVRMKQSAFGDDSEIYVC